MIEPKKETVRVVLRAALPPEELDILLHETDLTNDQVAKLIDLCLSNLTKRLAPEDKKKHSDFLRALLQKNDSEPEHSFDPQRQEILDKILHKDIFICYGILAYNLAKQKKNPESGNETKIATTERVIELISDKIDKLPYNEDEISKLFELGAKYAKTIFAARELENEILGIVQGSYRSSEESLVI